MEGYHARILTKSVCFVAMPHAGGCLKRRKSYQVLDDILYEKSDSILLAKVVQSSFSSLQCSDIILFSSLSSQSLVFSLLSSVSTPQVLVSLDGV